MEPSNGVPGQFAGDEHSDVGCEEGRKKSGMVWAGGGFFSYLGEGNLSSKSMSHMEAPKFFFFK